MSKPDDIERCQIQIHNRPQRDMVAMRALQCCGLCLRHDPAFAEAEPVGRVEQKTSCPRSCASSAMRKTAVAVDIDGFDRVHLKGHA